MWLVAAILGSSAVLYTKLYQLMHVPQIFYVTILISQITHSTAKWSSENIHFHRYKVVNQLAASHPMLRLLGPSALSSPHFSAHPPILIHTVSYAVKIHQLMCLKQNVWH